MSDAIERLYAAVIAARSENPPLSRTARLIQDGLPKMVKKLVEEAVEVGIDSIQGEQDRVVEESVDLIYNLAVLWSELGIVPADVWAEMDRRERLLGIAEKLPKR
jgi:phosphoribosyl-ATP pyrophosphohydrolase